MKKKVTKYKLPICTLFLLGLFPFYTCNNDKASAKKNKCYASYELIGPARDTVNLLDCDKRKQGKWIPSPTNDLKDTVFYRNDSVISHLN